MTRLLLASLLWLPLAAFAVTPGQLAPLAAGPQLSGGVPLDLLSLRGKVVLLDFFASWCGPCALSLPALEKLRRELQAQYPDRFEVLAVNVDDQPSDGLRFMQRRGASFPAIFDAGGRIAGSWALPGMPSSFLVDADGRVNLVHTGFRSGDEQPLRAAILALLNAGPDH